MVVSCSGRLDPCVCVPFCGKDIDVFWDPFLEGARRKFPDPDSHSKVSNLMITEPFYSTEVLFIREISGVHTSVFWVTDNLKMALRDGNISVTFEKQAQNRWSKASSHSAIFFVMLSCYGCRIIHELSNFRYIFLIDGLLTNQTALLLPVCGPTEFGKMFGIAARDSSSPQPFPLFRNTPHHFFPFFYPRRASSLARVLARFFRSLSLEKERKRPLHRLLGKKREIKGSGSCIDAVSRLSRVI